MTKGPPPNHHGLIPFPDGFSSVFDIEGNESVTQYNRFLRINVKFAMYVLVTNITIYFMLMLQSSKVVSYLKLILL